MSLQTALGLFLQEYPKAVVNPFASHPVANFIRTVVPETLRSIVGVNPRYIVTASPGQGNWAKAPWAAVFDRLVTDSAQDGYYVVYLVKEDFSGIYLSLNQGITSAKKQYSADAKEILRIRAADFLARLGNLPKDIQIGTIDLVASSNSHLSAYYEIGTICSKYYSRDALPDDEVLSADLRQFLDLYLLLVSRESQLYERADADEDEASLGEEDLRMLREHKRVERNKKLAHKAKQIHGYVCQACGFDFTIKYGDIGKEFIEAHHLTPLAQLRGQRLTLDAKRDFSVLCSNCHRMIHRTTFVSDIDAFRAQCVKATSLGTSNL